MQANLRKFAKLSTDLSRGLRSDLEELPQAFLMKDPAARNRKEVLFLYPGVKAILAHRLAHALWNEDYCFAARAISELSRAVTGIEIHPGARIGRRVVIDHGTGVVVGETAIIEDDVTIYQGVTLGSIKNSKQKRHPTISKGATIGVGAAVLGNITVGRDARVGAGSVLLTDVADGVSVGGIPAQTLSQRSSKRSTGQSE